MMPMLRMRLMTGVRAEPAGVETALRPGRPLSHIVMEARHRLASTGLRRGALARAARKLMPATFYRKDRNGEAGHGIISLRQGHGLLVYLRPSNGGSCQHGLAQWDT